ncbi:MAG: hypothetical protein K6E13_11835 [Lachnospiraceae bacterium]|nr:hypothetical protein [Lachnospiraceae bacterium]
MYKIKDFTGVNTNITEVNLDGEKVFRVVKADKINLYDENTYARLSEFDFSDGVIELDMLSRLLPDAPDFARGFIGIAYRIKDDDSEFESFYVRPTNGMTDDPVRKSHGCQYFSYPGYTFAYFREFKITDFEAPIDFGLDEWIHLKAVIEGESAKFYLNNKSEPYLEVEHMKHGKDAKGAVGIFVDIGTEAFVKNLKIEKR